MASITVNYTIPFGSSVRIGYRVQSSSDPFIYISPYPNYSGSPYTISGLPVGNYEVELTTVCPNCSGAVFGEPQVYPAISL
jgi:hypothetical protein